MSFLTLAVLTLDSQHFSPVWGRKQRGPPTPLFCDPCLQTCPPHSIIPAWGRGRGSFLVTQGSKGTPWSPTLHKHIHIHMLHKHTYAHHRQTHRDCRHVPLTHTCTPQTCTHRRPTCYYPLYLYLPVMFLDVILGKKSQNPGPEWERNSIQPGKGR